MISTVATKYEFPIRFNSLKIYIYIHAVSKLKLKPICFSFSMVLFSFCFSFNLIHFLILNQIICFDFLFMKKKIKQMVRMVLRYRFCFIACLKRLVRIDKNLAVFETTNVEVINFFPFLQICKKRDELINIQWEKRRRNPKIPIFSNIKKYNLIESALRKVSFSVS